MKKITKLFLLMICLFGLIIFQRDGVMPNVLKVISSDLFLEDTDDLGDTNAISNSMTAYAHQHCNEYILKEYGGDLTLTLAENAINTWNIGNHDYVVNGEVIVQPEEGTSVTKKYVCRIQHDLDDGQPNNFDSWSLYDISGLDDL